MTGGFTSLSTSKPVVRVTEYNCQNPLVGERRVDGPPHDVSLSPTYPRRSCLSTVCSQLRVDGRLDLFINPIREFTHARTLMHSHTHTHTHTHTHAHECTHTHTHTHTSTSHTHTPPHPRPHTHAPTPTHPHTHTFMYRSGANQLRAPSLSLQPTDYIGSQPKACAEAPCALYRIKSVTQSHSIFNSNKHYISCRKSLI